MSTYMSKAGVILAEVTNITDPDKLNRIKCKPVSSDEDVAETDWCYCLTPMGGNQYGQFFFPHVGDLVLLGFMGGDVHHPVVFGSYWANDVKPPYSIEDGKNEICSIKTPAGIEIKFEDTAQKQKLTLTTPSGATILVDDENKTIAIKDGEAANQLSIAWTNGEITLAAKTKLTLSAGDASLVLESTGSITATGTQAVSIKGADVGLKADNSIKAEGMQVDLESSGMLNVKASGNAVIKGAMVQIN